MPRIARDKSTDSIYHIMSRSISEVDLFKDDNDKEKYISIIKKYQIIHHFNIYCYCLMKNHVHLIIDSNGSDISQIMHGINFSYAQYFNKTHKRHGHLFQDRFKSKIIKDQSYLITASAYIHNNPTAISSYATCPEEFEFSSLSVYLGLKPDIYGLIDSRFILSLFGNDYGSARKKYLDFVFKCNNDKFEDFEFKNEGTLYHSQRKIIAKSTNFVKILEYVAHETNMEKAMLHTKHNKKATEAKALLVLLLKALCNYNSTKICSVMGNITQTNISRLTGIGLGLIEKDPKYRFIFEKFIK